MSDRKRAGGDATRSGKMFCLHPEEEEEAEEEAEGHSETGKGFGPGEWGGRGGRIFSSGWDSGGKGKKGKRQKRRERERERERERGNRVLDDVSPSYTSLQLAALVMR